MQLCFTDLSLLFDLCPPYAGWTWFGLWLEREDRWHCVWLKPASPFGSWHKLGFEVTFEAIFGEVEVHRAYAATFPDWWVLQTQLDNPGFQQFWIL